MTATFADRLADVRRARAEAPDAIGRALAARHRRSFLRGDGRLFLVAADHPARGALAVGADPRAMADRGQLLERLATALSRPGVDGVLATPDIVDDLALLGLLDDRVVVGSMNRGGLRGAAFEIDDRFTAYDARGLAADRLDAGKTLLRIDPDDPVTAGALAANAEAVTACAAEGLPILLEPFLSRRREGAAVNDLSTDAVILSVAIAAGLGSTSAFTWLKLPVVEEMDRVMAATTLPTLLLGGDAGPATLDQTMQTWADALALPGVRGLTVGRTLLYPADDDVAGAVDRAAALVHGPSLLPETRTT